MNGKTPAFFFYPGDYLKDPSVAKCSLATRGAWIELLCAMHENGRTGTITGTITELARICRCEAGEMASVIDELKRTQTAHVTKCHGLSQKFSITNRRMVREHKLRESARLRQRDHRAREKSPECHTSSSSSSSSSSSEERSKGVGKRERERRQSAPKDSLSETFLDELQARHPHKDVRKIRAKYGDHCRAKGVDETPEGMTSWCHNERVEDAKSDESSSDRIARVVAGLSGDY